MRAFLIGVYRGLCLIGLLIFTALWLVAHVAAEALDGAVKALDDQVMQ